MTPSFAGWKIGFCLENDRVYSYKNSMYIYLYLYIYICMTKFEGFWNGWMVQAFKSGGLQKLTWHGISQDLKHFLSASKHLE